MKIPIYARNNPLLCFSIFWLVTAITNFDAMPIRMKFVLPSVRIVRAAGNTSGEYQLPLCMHL